MCVARDGRNAEDSRAGRERIHGPSRTNPEINVIVYHRGNVIPDREDKWQRNMIRCTAVGRPRRWGAFSFLVFTYRSEGRSLGRCPSFSREVREGTTALEDERSEMYTSLRSSVVYDRDEGRTVTSLPEIEQDRTLFHAFQDWRSNKLLYNHLN